MTDYIAMTDAETGETRYEALPDEHSLHERETIAVSADKDTLLADGEDVVLLIFQYEWSGKAKKREKKMKKQEQLITIQVSETRYRVALNKKGVAEIPLRTTETGMIQIEVLEPAGEVLLLQAVPKPITEDDIQIVTEIIIEG